MARKRKYGDDLDDFIVEDDELSGEEESSSSGSSEEGSDEEPECRSIGDKGGKPGKENPAKRSKEEASETRRSQRAPAQGTRQRNSAKLEALKKLTAAKCSAAAKKDNAPASAAAPARGRPSRRRKIEDSPEPSTSPSPSPAAKGGDTRRKSSKRQHTPPPSDGKDRDSLAASSSPSPSPPPQRKPPARRGTAAAIFGARSSQRARPNQLVTGARDYAERQDSGNEDGLEDFVVTSSGEEEEEEELPGREGTGGWLRGKGVKERPQYEVKPRTAGGVREWAEEDEEDDEREEEEVEEDAPAAASRQEGDEEKEIDDEDEEDAPVAAPKRPASATGRRPSAQRAVILSSSDESEEEELPTAAPAPAPAPKRKRLRKRGEMVGEGGGGAAASAAPAGVEEYEDLHVAGPSAPAPKVEEKKKKALEEQLDGLGLRKRPSKPQLTAAERIAQAQRETLAAEEEIPVQQDKLEREEVELLTDEGEPSTSHDEGGLGGPEEGSEEEEGRSRAGGRQELQARPEALQRVAEELGVELGVSQRSPREIFGSYVEYLTLCYVDPNYRDKVVASKEHKAHYSRAVHTVEAAMTTARNAVHSEAWRSCERGLLEAVEWLSGVESGWDPGAARDREERWDEYDDGDVMDRCAACNRKKSHTTRVITFKGFPRAPPEDETWDDAPSNLHLSNAYLHASPVYIKNRQKEQRTQGRWGRHAFQLGTISEEEDDHEGGGADFLRRRRKTGEEEEEEEEVGEGLEAEADLPFDPEEGPSGQEYVRKRFRVGQHCSARLMLYHGLVHWKHRLLARIKRELKAELHRRRAAGLKIDAAGVADAILNNEDLQETLYLNYKALREAGETYQLSGGEGGNFAWRGRDPHSEVPALLAQLHDESNGEESSVTWEEEEEEKYEEEEGGSAAENGEERTPVKQQQQQQEQQQRQQLVVEEEVGTPADARRRLAAPGLGPDLAEPSTAVLSVHRRNSSAGLKQVDIRKFF